jgi:hypothetical protein
MPSILRFLAALLIATATRVALAHPGHGVTDPGSVTHQIVEPVHAVPWMLLSGISVVLTATGGLLWQQQRTRRRAVATAGDRRRSITERS